LPSIGDDDFISVMLNPDLVEPVYVIDKSLIPTALEHY